MDETATSNTDELSGKIARTALDALIETDSVILEQVRKDLSEEYIRFMSRVLKEREAMQSGGSGSLIDYLQKAKSAAAGLKKSS
jgi:hypothetical protein